MALPIKFVSLTRKLLLSTLLVCFFISVVVSLVEVRNRQEWQREQIRKSFKNFSAGPLREVSEAVWNYNWKMVQAIVDSQTSQLFTFMKICDKDAVLCIQQGKKDRAPFLDFRIQVNYQSPSLEIGQVYIQAGYRDYLTLLKNEFPKIFLLNSIGVFGLAAIIFLLFHHQAVRRMVAVEKYTREIDLADVERLQPLAAANRPASLDEIDRLTDAVDGLVGQIKNEFNRRRQLEQQLTQAQKMEALGTLAGGVAHDFNNILAAILGYGQLCAAGVEPGSKVHERLQQIIHAGQRAKTLISQILIFSRHTEANQEKIQLAAVVSEALTLIRASLPANIQIETELDESLWTLGDATQLHQVVMNLASNAGYVMAESGGCLKVSVSRQTATEEWHCLQPLKTGGYICLQIEDDGPGIPADIRDRIFDPFFTTKKVGKGTGMGLAVVHGIVQSHKGAICLDSEAGQGTCFRICLPETEPEDTELTSDAAEVIGGQERILLVDDEPAVIDMGKGLLEDLGYQVTATSNPLQALDLLQKGERFDLLISDLTMPEMSGTDLAKKVWQKNPDLPVIIWTGFADQSVDNSLKIAGVRDVLYKPFTVVDLDSAVRKILDSTGGSTV